MGYDRANRAADTYDWCLVVREIVISEWDKDARILDVGAGFGKYRLLLPEYPAMDAIEIWEPYIEEEQLRELYRTVYTGDICEFAMALVGGSAVYDLAILGDVLEHIRREKAKALIQVLTSICGDVLVVVPYEYEQGEEHGNPYQRHLQPDLTPELMETEYPELKLAETETRDGKLYRGLYRARK